MTTHSSILAWRLPWTEEPGGLQSIGLQRIGHDLVLNNHNNTTFKKTFIFLHCGKVYDFLRPKGSDTIE